MTSSAFMREEVLKILATKVDSNLHLVSLTFSEDLLIHTHSIHRKIKMFQVQIPLTVTLSAEAMELRLYPCIIV